MVNRGEPAPIGQEPAVDLQGRDMPNKATVFRWLAADQKL